MEYECMPLYQAWEMALEQLKASTCLREDELDAVCSFGRSLGAGDTAEQLKYFQMLQQRLQYALEQAENSNNANNTKCIFFIFLISLIKFVSVYLLRPIVRAQNFHLVL